MSVEKQKEIIKLLLYECDEIVLSLKKPDEKKDRKAMIEKQMEKIKEISDPENVQEALLETFSLFTTLAHLASIVKKVNKIAAPPEDPEDEFQQVKDMFVFLGDIEKNIKMPKFDGPAIDEGEQDGKKDKEKGK